MVALLFVLQAWWMLSSVLESADMTFKLILSPLSCQIAKDAWSVSHALLGGDQRITLKILNCDANGKLAASGVSNT